MTKVPDEVLERATWLYGPGPLGQGDPIDTSRLVWISKFKENGDRDPYARDRGWRRAERMTRTAPTNPWRRCHTERFWAWYCLIPLDPAPPSPKD